MARTLLGNRGRALYPPRNFQPALTNRRGTTGDSNAGDAALSFFSRQSLMILTVGILIGYLMLPVLLVNHLGSPVGFDAIQMKTFVGQQKFKVNDVSKIGTISISNKAAEPSRYLSTKEKEEINAPELTKYGEEEEDQQTIRKEGEGERLDKQQDRETETVGEEETNPEEPEQVLADDGGVESEASGSDSIPNMPGEEQGRIIQAEQSRTNITATNGRVSFVQTLQPESLTPIEKRIIEQQDTLSKQSIPTTTTPYVMKTNLLPDHSRMKILVTGGAGFVGSHLVDKLMMQGHEVIVVDNFFTGQKKNIAHWLHHPNFSLIVHDVTEPLTIEVDQIYHLACPASPPHYQYNPVKTIKTSTMGTLNILGLAKRVRARVLLTSTSEIYGDPRVHPQNESYWGNVNTIGPRSCYDEGKRVAETMMYSYRNQNNVDVRVARIFNTFGPRMHPNDGRVVSNFIIQSLQNKNITIYGEGKQTRSFQYVSDLVEGLHALMNGNYDLPVNLGNPDEYSVKDFAENIKHMTNSKSEIIFLPKSQDDPSQRKPDISIAKRELSWSPKVTVKEGLKTTIKYFAAVLKQAGEIIPTGPGAAKPEA